MRYIILKELLPSLKGTPNYDESMNFITKCICIENDEMFSYSIENDSLDSVNVIAKFLNELNHTLLNDNLTENEIKLGQALCDLFGDYEQILSAMIIINSTKTLFYCL